MRRAFMLTTAVAVLAGASTAHAESNQAPPADVAGAAAANAVESVVVVANRRPESLDKIGQSVTVLTLEQIRADQEPVISDLLARTPGVSVTRTGGPGATTSLRIRGAESDQTVVLIDGVKMNDPSSTGGGYNFADLLVGDVARLEILRGPQSTLYGSQAIGGVVNIVTADPTRALQGDVNAEGGSYSTAYGKAALGGRQGPWSFRGAVSAYTTAGVSNFNERRGGKEADGYHNTAFTGRLGYAFSENASADLRAYYAETRNEFDGFPPPNYVLADTPDFGRSQQFVGYAGLNVGLFGDRLKNRVALQYTQIDRQNLNPTQPVTPYTFDASGKNRRFEYQGSAELAPGWLATFGAESERSAFRTASPSAYDPHPVPTRKTVGINSLYAQVTGEVLTGLTLTGGLRRDDHDTFGEHITGQASAAWSLFDGSTVLRTSWGQGFKAPTLYQLYSFYGNTDVKPEQAEGWDSSVEQRFWQGRAVVQATYFGRDSTNLIGFVSCPSAGRTGRCVTQPNGYYSNTARAETRGVELSGVVKPVQGLQVAANYTYTDAKDRSPTSINKGRELVRRPRDMANVTASYQLPVGVTAAVAARYAGASFDNTANTNRLKSYTLIDLRASYPLRQGLELYGRVENLFDRNYETAYLYGNLGRAAYAGVRASF